MLGRFMSEDPKQFDAGDYNLFRYCHNDPLDTTDPMGLEPPPGIELPQPRQVNPVNPFNRSPTFGYSIDKWGPPGSLSQTYTAHLHNRTMNYNEAAGLQNGVVYRDAGKSISNKPEIFALNGKPVWDPYVHKWVMVPSGVSLDKNIDRARQMSPPAWIQTVYKHGEWDYKDKGPYRDFGNINYGATGRAVGYDGFTLRAMGVLYKASQLTITKQDLARDQHMIQVGIDYYNNR
jgi:hypothetical protein